MKMPSDSSPCSKTRFDIRPSKLSYFGGNNALAVQFRGKSIRSIKPLGGGTELDSAEIEPELITNLFDRRAREAPAGALRRFAG